jgi:hypothetical protein
MEPGGEATTTAESPLAPFAPDSARVYSLALGGAARQVAEKVSAAFEAATKAGSIENVTQGNGPRSAVELTGVEPVTSCLPSTRSTN